MVGLPADCCVVDGLGASVTVVIAWGKRPVPFRTRKLRLTAPRVLHQGGCGREGHSRTVLSRVGAPLWLVTGPPVCGVVAFEGFPPLFLFNQPPHTGYNAVSRGRAVLSAHLMRLCVRYYLRT